MKVKFGALSPKLYEQIAADVPQFTKLDFKHFQADADAVTRLCIRGLLSDSETTNARKKIMKAIVKKASSK